MWATLVLRKIDQEWEFVERPYDSGAATRAPVPPGTALIAAVADSDVALLAGYQRDAREVFRHIVNPEGADSDGSLDIRGGNADVERLTEWARAWSVALDPTWARGWLEDDPDRIEAETAVFELLDHVGLDVPLEEDSDVAPAAGPAEQDAGVAAVAAFDDRFADFESIPTTFNGNWHRSSRRAETTLTVFLQSGARLVPKTHRKRQELSMAVVVGVALNELDGYRLRDRPTGLAAHPRDCDLESGWGFRARGDGSFAISNYYENETGSLAQLAERARAWLERHSVSEVLVEALARTHAEHWMTWRILAQYYRNRGDDRWRSKVEEARVWWEESGYADDDAAHGDHDDSLFFVPHERWVAHLNASAD